MKYRVTGSNRQTGARMTLELEASSRAAVEQQAIRSGMNVNHVQDITDLEASDDAPAAQARAAHRGGSTAGGGTANVLAMLIFIAVAVGLVWFFWSKIKPLIGR